MDEPLTRPERFAEIAGARRLRSKVAKDPCAYCTHRQELFGKSFCPTLGRIWPRCMNTPGLQFEPDHKKLGESDHAPNK